MDFVWSLHAAIRTVIYIYVKVESKLADSQKSAYFILKFPNIFSFECIHTKTYFL